MATSKTQRSAAAKTNGRSGHEPKSSPANRARMAEVISAATEMFYEHGYKGTSILKVAEAVGILKGSLYYYMDSKEDLLYRVVDEVQRDIHEILHNALADSSLPPLDRLRNFALASVEYNARNVKLVAVYHNDWRRLKGDRLADVTRRRQRENKAVRALLTEARDRGDVPATLDIALATSCVFATIIWPHTWYREGGVDPAKLAAFYADFVLHGLGAPADA